MSQATTLTSLAAFIYFRRHREHNGSVFACGVARAVGFIGLGAGLILGMANFASLTGGSGLINAIFMTVSWGVPIAGMIVAVILRKRRPEVYARIGRN
jgi:hypothetical protein